MLEHTHSLPPQDFRLFRLVDGSNPPVTRPEYDGVPIKFGRLSPHARHNQPVIITADEMPDSFSSTSETRSTPQRSHRSQFQLSKAVGGEHKISYLPKLRFAVCVEGGGQLRFCSVYVTVSRQRRPDSDPFRALLGWANPKPSILFSPHEACPKVAEGILILIAFILMGLV